MPTVLLTSTDTEEAAVLFSSTRKKIRFFHCCSCGADTCTDRGNIAGLLSMRKDSSHCSIQSISILYGEHRIYQSKDSSQTSYPLHKSQPSGNLKPMTTLYGFSSLDFGIKTLQLGVVNVWYIKLTLMKPFPWISTFALLMNEDRFPLISVYAKTLLQKWVYVPSIWEKYKESRFKEALLKYSQQSSSEVPWMITCPVLIPHLFLKIQLHYVAADSRKVITAREVETMQEPGHKKGKPRNKDCENTNWEAGIMVSTAAVTYLTLLSMNTGIWFINSREVPSSETAQPS